VARLRSPGAVREMKRLHLRFTRRTLLREKDNPPRPILREGSLICSTWVKDDLEVAVPHPPIPRVKGPHNFAMT
jgi:hypothetical protein